jgi:hypothetical protein
MKIEAHVRWDDRALENIIEAIRVYIVTFEISLLPNDLGLDLEDLILLPIIVQVGQFRRVGWFRVTYHWRNLYEDEVSLYTRALQEAKSTGDNERTGEAKK